MKYIRKCFTAFLNKTTLCDKKKKIKKSSKYDIRVIKRQYYFTSHYTHSCRFSVTVTVFTEIVLVFQQNTPCSLKNP